MVCLVKLEHSDVARHQATVFKRLQRFRKEGKLCDVVLKGRGGTKHQAHMSILCAASEDFQNMLIGPFLEGGQVQQAQPVEMAASDSVVAALLECIYGEEPQVELEDSFELLRLADAFNFKELASAIKASLHASLNIAPAAAALKVLLQTQDLHELKAGCEAKVAENFAMCIELADFLELSAGQLGRILQRPDLRVPREEVVFEGLMKWFNKSKDRGVHLPLLLQNIDFQALSSKNLARLGHLSTSMGPIGHDLQRDVQEARAVHKKRSAAEALEPFRPKRHCLRHWSPDLGSNSQAPKKVLPLAYSMCWHDGAIYYVTNDPRSGSTIFRWKPGDAQSQPVAGSGARVNGENVLGLLSKVSVSPQGEIFVADYSRRRLVKFENGSGSVVLNDGVRSVFCSQSGAVYVLTHLGGALNKLVGARLQPVVASDALPAELQFEAFDFFVTRDETIYISDRANGRVLRLNPREAEPVVVGVAPNKERSEVRGLFVTEEEKVYVADLGQQKVWAFHPGDATWTEVLCPRNLRPLQVSVQGTSLYVSIDGAVNAEGVYEYLLPPDLLLEPYRSALTCCQIPSTPS